MEYLTVPRGDSTIGLQSTISKVAKDALPKNAESAPVPTSGGQDFLAKYTVPTAAAFTVAVAVVSFTKLMLRRRERSPQPIRRPRTGGSPTAVGSPTAAASPALGPSDKYEKMDEIGRGAFGIVYVGRHRRTGNLVAIKEMHQGEASDELRTEYTLLKGLTHPNVVDILGFEVLSGKAKLYLEWVAGGSLAMLIQKTGPVGEDLLKTYSRQLLLGLQFLHDHNILHRDIKPKNILVDHRGQLKLTDFGLSRHQSSMNVQTKAAGTPVYMAPECIRGRFSVGSDLWALGATLSEIATGRVPWSHLDPNILNTPMSLLFHIGQFEGNARHHPEIPDWISPDGQAFMKKLFSPMPKDRGTCEELLNDPFLSGALDFQDSAMFSPQNSSTQDTSSSSGPPPTREMTATGGSVSLTTDSSMRGTAPEFASIENTAIADTQSN